MDRQGYYRFPALQGDTVWFVAEDDVWCVPAAGGVARRLTAGLGEMGRLAVSPDGQWLAVTAREEKHAEVWVLPAAGGPLHRLTFLGADTHVRGFTPDGEVLFVTDAAWPFPRLLFPHRVPLSGGQPRPLGVGPAHHVAFGPGRRMVLGRNTGDPARWKRYRGGTAGRLWVDATGEGAFRPLIELDGNLTDPMWIGERVWFLSDHEGIGNLYSCTPAGGDLRRHTDHAEHYARCASSDGRRIVYQCGASLWVHDPAGEAARRVDVEWRGPATQTQRRFVEASRFLGAFALHPEGHSLAVEARGKAFTFPLWEEAVRPHGQPDGVRYRLPQWLADGERVVAATDESGEERLVVFGESAAHRYDALDVGRIVTLAAAPRGNVVALSNHRNELVLADLDEGRSRVVDRSPYRHIEDIAWSPDGRWLAYAFATSPSTSAIKLCEQETGRVHFATRPQFRDFAPAFDPEGRYLYFLSYRAFDPVYDALYFDLNFPRGVRPCLALLSAEEPSPFVPRRRPLKESGAVPPGAPAGASESAAPGAAAGPDGAPRPAPPAPVRVDVEGLADRVLAFPVPEGIYRQIGGTKGKALLTSFPVRGSLGETWTEEQVPAGELMVFDFATLKLDSALAGVGRFALARDGTSLALQCGRRLRVVDASGKIEKADGDTPSRKTGWIDLSRVRVSVEPRSEWRQMLRDIWRLQRDQFWDERMSGVDWPRVWERYAPLLDRVGTRAEFSDLVWEMQGELGTSHAYEMGGDHRPPPETPLGFLGADFEFDATAGCWRIARIVRGDAWDPDRGSPLAAPGVRVSEGSRLLAVGGRAPDEATPPQALLVNHAAVPVELTVADADGANARTLTVLTRRDETPARYRDWVARNRERVHGESGGRLGYVHLPDMGPWGYSEFHRDYQREAERTGLIVDVRYNRGGHVSQLILEKLARRRIGYDVSRWGAPDPYPSASVLGPLVALTNELAGSDGDIFSHCFKLMGLGPLVGTRTWGGVVGIWPRYRLVDGSVTTQPEFSFWFTDVGWGVENYGTDPDHHVEIAPHDWAAGRDPQLERAIALAIAALEANPPALPDFGGRPHLPLPVLPPRP